MNENNDLEVESTGIAETLEENEDDSINGKQRFSKSGSWVAMPNRMFAFTEKFAFATNDEIYVFYILGTMVSARNNHKIECNIELLNSKIKWDLNNPARGKKNQRNSNWLRKKRIYLD